MASTLSTLRRSDDVKILNDSVHWKLLKIKDAFTWAISSTKSWKPCYLNIAGANIKDAFTWAISYTKSRISSYLNYLATVFWDTFDLNPWAGNPYWRGRLCTIDLLVMIACFVKEKNIIFSIISTWSKLASAMRSLVLILPLLLLPTLV